jgi:predicted PP-loop superfamily ATPase
MRNLQEPLLKLACVCDLLNEKYVKIPFGCQMVPEAEARVRQIRRISVQYVLVKTDFVLSNVRI